MKKNIMIFALLFAVLAGSFYLIFMRFQLAFKIDNKSYVFTSNKVIENLYVNGLSGEDVKIDYTVAEENEQVYKQGNKYFIGENQKEEISIEYPMLSEDGSRVSNMGNYKILITEDFKIATTFDNAILSEGALYNGTSMDRVDKENYFLFNIQDKVYLNATKITIDLGNETREIPMNSIVYFMEHEIRYYFLYNETFLYSVITGIDDLDTVHFFNSSIGYRDMLLNLEVIVEEEEPEIYIPEEIIPPVRDEEFVIPEDEYVYIKPEATTEVVSISVYSFKVNLSLNDNARRIETSPTYEIKYNGKTFLRKTLYSTGTFEISGLLPNTEFELVAYFTYRNEHDKLIKKTMLTTTIHTKDISLLEPIKLVYNNDNLYPNKLEFNKMKFMNGKNDEVLKGIKDMEAYINGERYLVSSGNVQKLKKLQEIDYETPPSLKSNTIYDVKFVIYDIAGNELVVENNVTKSKTLKAKPTADISITGTDLTYFDSFIEITNVDNVNIENLIYVITDGDNNIITQGPVGDGNIHVGDLDINSVYNILVYADYDLEDGKGVQKSVLLKQGKVTTKPLSTLGFVRFNLQEKELTQTDAIFDLTINQSSTDEKLLAILDKIYFTIKVKNTDEIVQEVTIEGDDVVNLKTTGNSYLLELLGLYSNTYYKIEVTTDVKQGSKVYNIKGLLNLTEFATLKQPATIDIVNQFTNESLIDYDVKVTDLDGAIESNRVILYVRDSSGTLVSYKNLPINGEYERFSFDKLEKEEKYTFTYLVGSYNLGYTNATYEEDKILLEKTIETKVGIYGSIQLDSLLKQITSENLFDINNNKRWKKEGNSTISDRTIDSHENIITLSVKNGYGTYSYYLPEGKGETLQISFDIRHTKNSNMQNVYISNGGGSNKQILLTADKEWSKVSMNITLNNNCYFGFYIDEISNNNTITSVQIRNLMITSPTQSNNIVLADSYYNSQYIFSDTIMLTGKDTMPSTSGTGTMSGNSESGYARITNLTNNSVTTFSYTGSEQLYTVPTTGKYKIELWGAAGGDGGNAQNMNYGSHAGRGGYTSGIISLNQSTKLYVYVGEKGLYGNSSLRLTYNGGGAGGNSSSGSGGGATDVRLVNGQWNNVVSLKSRIMVAGGGGGADNWGGTYNGNDDGRGGHGGGITAEGAYINGVLYSEYGGSQLQSATSGTLGIGGTSNTSTDTGGGGGGFYGGGATSNNNGGAGGGSSYISGHQGCISVTKQDKFLNVPYKSYSEKEALKGIFYVNLTDSNEELEDPHFYVEMLENDVLVDTVQYDMENPHLVENMMLEYEFSKNKTYEMVLNVKIRDRFYPIAKSFFTTDEEIRTIRTIDEFFNMHITGKYLVGADLDFREVNRSYPWLWFSGKIDFQGYKIFLDTTNSAQQLIPDIASDAVLSNMDVHYYLNNESARSNFYGLFYEFRGKLTNLKITVEEATNVPNVNFSLIAYVSNGTIENFVINNKAGLSGQRWTSLGPMHNYGVLRNGYVYGANINGSFPTTYPQQSKRIGALAGYAASNSRIENVYSLVGIDGVNQYATENYDIDNRIGSLVGEHNRGIVSNVYSYTSGTNRALTRDANIGNYSNVTAKNMFYVSDQIYNSVFSLKVAKLALKDNDFQNILNEDDMFNVEDYVPFGYYPQIKWPDCMPNQEYISLPSIDDADLIDITHVKETKIENNQTIAVLMVNNPSNEKITDVGIKDVTTVEIIDQVTEGGKTTLTIRLSNPLKYVSKYYVKTLTAKSAYGKEYSRTYADNERVLLIDMYRTINNEKEWLDIKTYPNENFILTSSLDFNNMPPTKFQISSVNGIINGNGHTIRNAEVTVNDGVIRNLYGKLINVNFENIVRTRDNAHDRFGIVGQAHNKSVIDNVHVKDITLYSYNRMGGLIGYADGVVVRNSSVTNVKTQPLSGQIDVEVGGLIGEAYNMAIDNCYVQNVNFDVTDAKVVNAVGGFIGYLGSGDIVNVYATGIINTNSPKVGGLFGYNGAYVRNTYSNVDITSKSAYVGGISGTGNNIANSFSVGSIYSYLDSDLVKRIAGNADANNNNYAWANQHVNGKITGETNGELLLTTEELADPLTYIEVIRFTEDFDYSDLTEGKLPKLKYTDGSKLLPYQIDNKLATYKFELLSIETAKSITDVTVQLQLNNPDNFEVTGIKVDDMVDQVTKKQTVNGVTTIELKLTPEKAFDSYKLSKIFYKDGDGNAKTYNTDIKLEAQFYKDLEKYEDWQKISQEYAENYRLVADIDFAGKANVNYNVLINRLEGTGDTKKVLKNIDINVKGNDQSLINNILSNINNVEFNNIKITSTDTSNVSRNGLILYTHGNFSNVDFKDITLNMPKANYVAPISFERTSDLRNVNLDGINVTGRDYSSGFIARAETIGVTNINASNVTINATGNYVGGIIGYATYYWTTVVFNINATDMNVTSTGNYVGSVFGYGGAQNINVLRATVVGNSYVGGVAGQMHAGYGNNVIITDSTVTGKANDIGGIAGYAYNQQYNYVDNVKIYGIGNSSNNVGGITGRSDHTVYNSGVKDSIIETTGSYVGGIKGLLSNGTIRDCYTYNTTIKGANYVGGMVGMHQSTSNTIARNVTNATITATGTGAGGILGYAVNEKTDDATNKIYLYHNIANATVTAGNVAGGLVGRMDKLPYDGHMYSNVVFANVTTTSNGSKPGIVIGSSDFFSYGIPNLKVFNGSLVNGVRISTEPEGIDTGVLTNLDTLKKQATYTNIGISTSYFSFDKLSSGFLPYNKSLKEGYYVYMPFPSGTVTPGSLAFAKAEMALEEDKLHLLPTFDIYASDINAINIEFSNKDPLTTMTVNGDSHILNHRLYTFNYDFKTNLEIKLSDGVNEKTYTYEPKDLKNKTYVKDKFFYLLKDDKVVTNNGVINGKIANIYDNKALRDDGMVISLETKEALEKQDNRIFLRGADKPLFTFDYNDLEVKTYYNYSTIGDKVINNQVFVKNGILEMINGGSNSYKQSIIIDSYNDKNYFVMLSKDGNIFNLKDKIKTPNNFDNAKIISMSNNLMADSSLIAILYENGGGLVFDYRTGVVSYKEYKNTSNLVDFYVEKFSQKASTTNIEETISSSYKNSKELIKQLEKTSIEEVNKGEDLDLEKSYISVYNDTKKSYDVYDVTDIVNEGKVDTDKLNTSVNDEINTDANLSSHYNVKKATKQSLNVTISQVIVFAVILVGILYSVIILGKNITKKTVN